MGCFIIFDYTQYNANIHHTTDACYSIYGGGWMLVRHAFNRWHRATDNLQGTDIYGTNDNDPQSTESWSIQFDYIIHTIQNGTIFMLSNGDCSEYLITTYYQVNLTSPCTQSNCSYFGYIIESNTRSTYYNEWFNRGPSFPADPLISYNLNDDLSILYAEGKNNYSERFFPTKPKDLSVNVWIS